MNYPAGPKEERMEVFGPPKKRNDVMNDGLGRIIHFWICDLYE